MRAWIFLASGLLSTGVLWANADAELRRFYQQVERFDARFEQRLLDEDGDTLEVYSGHFSLARPGRFSWIYESPYPLQLGSDGQTLWHYDIDLRQMTLRDADAVLAGTPAELLGGDSRRLEQFNITSGEASGELYWVVLTPKSDDTDFASIRIGLADGVPRSMELADRLGQITRMAFFDVQVNQELPVDRFALQLPAGVDVVDDRASAP